jgi:hypothetical protein
VHDADAIAAHALASADPATEEEMESVEPHRQAIAVGGA